MGWTGLYDKPRSIPEYFKSRWEHVATPDAPFTQRCLGQAFVGRFTLYGVWERTDASGKTDQWASIVLVRYNSGQHDLCRWYYKDMDESVGPNEHSMPRSLLVKLKTPAINSYAREWRKACWQEVLGLTRSSRIKLIRRYWKRNISKALALMDEWNSSNPTEQIYLTRSNT